MTDLPISHYITHNAVVGAAYQLCSAQDLPRTRFLELAVCALANQNERLIEDLVTARMLMPTAYVMPGGERVVCHVPDEFVPARKLENQ